MPRDHSANELCAVAPLVVLGPTPRLIAPVTLVANGDRVMGVTSAELLRPHQGAQLAIVTKLDGSATVRIASWFMGRYSGVGLVELAEPMPAGSDIVPMSIGAVHASVNTHGAPAALVGIRATPTGYARVIVDVHVDADDGGGMSDHTVYLASPLAPTDVEVEGASVFAWLPPEPALGRRGELVVFAVAYPYRAQIAKPRELPVIGELAGLEDLGKTLLAAIEPTPDERPELGTVVGEIEERDPDPLAGLDE